MKILLQEIVKHNRCNYFSTLRCQILSQPCDVKTGLFCDFWRQKKKKTMKNWRFFCLRNRFSRVRLRNRLYSLKSPLHSFSRAFEWYKWFWVLNFVIFRQFFGVQSSARETGKTTLWPHKVDENLALLQISIYVS